MIDRILKLPAYNPAAPDFSDVSTGDWFYASVENAVYAGIVKGYGNSAFKPDDPITREEMANILVNVLGKQDEAGASMDVKTGFKDDARISSWAQGIRGGGRQVRPAQGLSGRQLQAAGQCHPCRGLRRGLELPRVKQPVGMGAG